MDRAVGCLRIAVADDEPDTLEFLKDVLPRLGHTVILSAATGRQLVEECQANHPDLVITDIKMPDLDGIEAAVRGADLEVPNSFSSNSQPKNQLPRRDSASGLSASGAIANVRLCHEKRGF